MLKTEDEAKERWCPQAHDGSDQKCIASQCMAWRFDMTWESSTQEGEGGDLVVRLKRRQGDPKLGFCGLAGADWG